MKCKTGVNKAAGIGFSILFVLFFFQNCKKDSGPGSDSSGYYLTATVNGEPWSANVNSTLNNSPAIAAVTTSNGISIFILLGVKAVNKDSSAIAVLFPHRVTLDKATNFDASKYSEGAYVLQASPASSTYYGYNTTPATGGSGTFTVTVLDQSAKLIEGSFSGTFGSQTGRPAVQITNGKFRCPYTTDINQLPKSGGLKF